MTNKDYEKAMLELEFEKKEFINNVSLASCIIGIEIKFPLKTDEDGSTWPYMKLIEIDKEKPEKVDEFKKILQDQRKERMKSLGYKEAAIIDKPMADQYITDGIRNNKDRQASFMEVLGMIEKEFGFTMKPIIYASYDCIKGTYDVVEKSFPEEKSPTPEKQPEDEKALTPEETATIEKLEEIVS